jgi:hypothetical protein
MDARAEGEEMRRDGRDSLPGESRSWRTLLAGSLLFLVWGLEGLDPAGPGARHRPVHHPLPAPAGAIFYQCLAGLDPSFLCDVWLDSTSPACQL